MDKKNSTSWFLNGQQIAMRPGKLRASRETEFPRTTVWSCTGAYAIQCSPLLRLAERFHLYFISSASVHIYSLKSILCKRCQILFSNEYMWAKHMRVSLCKSWTLQFDVIYFSISWTQTDESVSMCIRVCMHIMVCCILYNSCEFLMPSYSYGKQRMNQIYVALYTHCCIACSTISSFCIEQCHVLSKKRK